MDESLDDGRLIASLDVVNHRLREYSNRLSSALLSHTILSNELINLNSEVFHYDTTVNQLINDSRYAQEFLAKLEALSVRAQFFEAQIEVLESHSRNKTLRSHQRFGSVNDFKDEMLDWRTSETTLENLYRELGHLKKQFMKLSYSSPQLNSPPTFDGFPLLISQASLFGASYGMSISEPHTTGPNINVLRTPAQRDHEPFENNLQFAISSKKLGHHNCHSPNNSSVSTTATSVFEDTAHFRPLRCSSKKKRKSSLNTIASALNEAPIPLREEPYPSLINGNFGNNNMHFANRDSVNDYQNLFSHDDNMLGDISVVKHYKRRSLSVPSFQDLLLDKYQGDFFIPQVDNTKEQREDFYHQQKKPNRNINKLKHFKSYQGLKIQYIEHEEDSTAGPEAVVKHESEVDFAFKFPAPASVAGPTAKVTKVPNLGAKSKSSHDVSKKQTLNWLLKIAEDETSHFSDTQEIYESPKKKTGTILKDITEPSIIPISHSTIFHSTTDVSKTSQSLLLDMMHKQTEKEKKLEEQQQQHAKKKSGLGFLFLNNNNDFIHLLSKNLLNLHIKTKGLGKPSIVNAARNGSTSDMNSDTESASLQIHNDSSLLRSTDARQSTDVSTIPEPDQESHDNVIQEKKQWGLMFAKFFTTLSLAYKAEKADPVKDAPQQQSTDNKKGKGKISPDVFAPESDQHESNFPEPVLENGVVLEDELQHALESDLLF